MENIRITENESNQRLDRFLRKLLKDESLKDIYRYIRKGIVKVNDKKSKENYRLQVDDIISLYNIQIQKKDNHKLSFKGIDIVYEDDNILIIDKPINLLSHPEKSSDLDTLIQRVLGYIKSTGYIDSSFTFSPALCNRLDRNTAGLVIAAINYQSLKSINKSMKNKGIIKHYICLVDGITKEEGSIENSIIKNKEERIGVISSDKNMASKKAITRYRKICDNGRYSLLKIELVTGRFHQIRLHLSYIGHPIIGDMKYGKKDLNLLFAKRFHLKHQFLIAYNLYFKTLTPPLEYLENKQFKARISKDYKKIIDELFGIDPEYIA